MKIFRGLRTAMKFVTPEQYSQTNQAHFVINTSAVNEFLKKNSPLAPTDRVLDFGCGTGETTVALAEGWLGNLGKPAEVVGVDISEDMIAHCRSVHSTPGLSFQRLDVEAKDCQAFCSSQRGSYSLVTSFSCLHWVPNQPAAVHFFNSILKKGGKLLLVIATSQNVRNNAMRREFERMRGEPEWAAVLSKTRWPHFKTVHVNNSWMSTVDSEGCGPIMERDYVKLLEKFGFQVQESKSIPLRYMFDRNFTRNFFKSTILTSFNELQAEDKEKFITEFVRRLKAQNPHNTEEYVAGEVDGFQVFAEKIAHC